MESNPIKSIRLRSSLQVCSLMPRHCLLSCRCCVMLTVEHVTLSRLAQRAAADGPQTAQHAEQRRFACKHQTNGSKQKCE